MGLLKPILLLIIFLLSGCTLTRGSSVLLGTSRPPINPSQVKLYTELPANYEKVALLSADSRNDFASQQNLTNAAIERLKEEAARLGANGILLDGIGNYEVGASGVIIANRGSPVMTGAMNTRTGKAATGVAIYVAGN